MNAFAFVHLLWRPCALTTSFDARQPISICHFISFVLGTSQESVNIYNAYGYCSYVQYTL